MSEIKVPAKKNLAKARGKSRRLAMQAIYQWQMTGDSIAGIKQQFLDENNPTKFDVEYFTELVSGVASTVSEFINRLDVPFRVVLNEAVTITKEFCSEKSHAFVNAVLDKVAKEIRQVEVQAKK